MSIILPAGETIQRKIKRHWIVFFEGVFTLVVAFIIFSVGLFIILRWLSSDGEIASQVLTVFMTATGLFTWVVMFFIWINYYLDIWVLTNRRVFDIEQHNLFARDISEFRLDKVQDITVEVKGIIATFLNYGDVHVQTAGRAREFIIRKVAKPYEVRDAISNEVDRVLDIKRGEDAFTI